MPHLKTLFAISTLLLSSLACATLLGERANTDGNSASIQVPPGLGASPDAQPPIASVEAASCPVITEQIVGANTNLDLSNNVAEDFNSTSDDDDELIYLVTYQIDGDQITDPYFEKVPASLKDEQDDLAAHQQIWDYYKSLIPAAYRSTLREFSIMTDGQENLLAAVWQTTDDPALWGMEVDIADADDYYYFSFTLIHEFAHLLTLGPDQVPPNMDVFNNSDDDDIYVRAADACPNFFTGEGCSKADSYMNAFYNQFWTGIYAEWDEINLIDDEDARDEALDDFYYKYEDQFLTDYSATHPAEDIAEAFGFFIFATQPDGDTIAEQKILFFYQYPELVQLRQEILANLCVNFPE